MHRDTPWPAGTPCWVDLTTTDIDASRLFYEGLFGWELPLGNPDFGGYTVGFLQGRRVAGMMPAVPGTENHPSVWSTYLATDDIEVTTTRVVEAGGTVMAAPMPVGEQGVMAFYQDSTQAAFGAWQSGDNTGVAVANVPSSLAWNELLTRDVAAAKRFYAHVFGARYQDVSDADGDGFAYATYSVGGDPVGGIGSMPAGMPENVPSHWRVYFAVDDADDAVDRVARLGGSVLRPAEDMPYGRWADIADPTGASFSVIRPENPSPDHH